MDNQEKQPSHSKLIMDGLNGRCPRCGEGKLFDGFLAIKPQCDHCDLDYGFADSGDGPAVFVMFAVGFLMIALVLWSEVSWSPPLWLHVVVWAPLTVVLSLAALRAFKGALIALQYRHRAAEGVIDRSGDE
ncbi:DUF983 domain-containing protein [Martelella mediterranea]|uniref:Uncharacterized protein (DUF983 family) n=1 Tax=Martelella mediterranea TaxID=293089 RepID=A0A4R3NQH0_9HYPH|nr:DUF983 domain-containing protein [Martelella mediterranea]TCT37317.1 uncharacterized protein (DUF983 family) [Martelella mediterranea]